MKKKYLKYLIGIIVALVIIVDLCVLLYPTVSGYINSHVQSRVVALYLDDMASMTDTESRALLEAARGYNKNLLLKKDRFAFSKEETAEYNGLLNNGRNVMGILVIDKINVNLPIYHGSDEGVLQVGLGHIPGTSLPVGGIGTHAFITGHRGLPSSTLLTDLNKVDEGDTFVLHVAGKMLTYQVDQIQTVEPGEVEALNIDPDKDYCTLVTCTPYGINTHRLLVRGHRVQNAANAECEPIYADARHLDKIPMILMFLIPVLPGFAALIIIKCRKIHKGGTFQ